MAKQQKRTDTRFFSVKNRINTCMALDVLFIKHRDHCHGCRLVSSRLITIRLRAVPFNIIRIQAYAPTSDYDDDKIEELCDQLQNVIDHTPKTDILVVQGDWNAKVGKDACGNWQGICGPFCNDDTNERGLRLLRSLPPLTTLCWRTHLVITKHPEDGHGIAKWTTPQPD